MSDFDTENAEGFQTEQLDLEESQSRDLLQYEPEEVKEMYVQKTISQQQADGYIALKDIQKNGLRKMNPVNAKFLYSNGVISQEQADSYLSFQEHPVWWTVKDIGKGAFRGVRNFAQSFWSLAKSSPTFNPLAPFQNENVPEWLKPDLPEALIKPFPDLPDPIKPESGIGKVAEVGTEFLIPFGAASKVLKGINYAPRVLAKLPGLAKKTPKLHKFLEFTLKDTTAGAVADLTFDPYEGRVADLMKDMDILPEFAEFMATNPDNPEAIERLKNVVEGGLIGLGLDAFLFGSRVFKGQVWDRYMLDGLKVQDELTEKFGLFMQKKGVEIPVLTDDVATKTAKEAPPAIKKSVESYDQAFRIFEDTAADIAEGGTVKTQHKVVDAMEAAGGDAQKLSEHIYRNSEEMMNVLRGGKEDPTTGVRKSRVETQKGADRILRKLIKDTGGRGNAREKMLDQMRKFGLDTKQMDSQVRAFNQFFVQYTEEVSGLVKEAIGADGTLKTKMKAIEHIKMLQEMEGQVYGIRADIGRTLGQYNMDWMRTRFDFDRIPTEGLTDLQRTQGKEIDGILNSFNKASTHRDKMALARFTGKNKWLQGALEFVQANLLWSPATQAVNLIGNASALIYDSIMRALGVGMDAVFTGDLTKIMETREFFKGVGKGINDCFRIGGLSEWAKGTRKASEIEFGNFWKAMATGDAQLDHLVKLEGQLGGGMEAIASSLRLPRFLSMPIIKMIQLPFHALTAGDELFKNIAYFSELNSLLFREGRMRGLRGDALDTWSKQMMHDVPPELHYGAIKRARDLTFQSEFAEGTMSKHMNEMLNTNVGTLFKITAIPFYKIAVNIVKFSAARSPLAVFSKNWQAAIKAGGPARYEAIAKLVTGSAMMYGAGELYDANLITGRIPPGQHDAWANAGKQPYSFKYKGKYYSYDRFDPFGMLVGFASDLRMLRDIVRYNENVPEQDVINIYSAAALTISEPVLNKTWMTSMQEILMAITQPDRMDLTKLGLRQAEKFHPATTGMDWYNANFRDNKIREVYKMIDVFHKKWNPKTLQARRHSVYGTEIERDKRVAATVKTRKISDDPVMIEMYNVRANSKKPEDKIGGRDMTPEQYARYNDIIVELPLKEILTEMIANPVYQQIGDAPTRAKLIKTQISRIRSAAKKILMSEDQTITDNMIADAHRKARSILGEEVESDAVKKLYHILEQRRNN